MFVSVIGISSALFLALPQLFRRAPEAMLNLPNKDYWFEPERREAANAKFSTWADLVGTAVNVLLATLQLVLASAAERPSGSTNPFPFVVVLAFASFVLGSCVWLIWAYRLPKRAR